MCCAGNAKADQMVSQQLQQLPPVFQALEHEIAQWKRFLALHAMIAEARYADVPDTDDPKQLVWEHEPPQPAPARGQWPQWLNELVLHAVQHVPDFQAKTQDAEPAPPAKRVNAPQQHMPVRKFPYPPVAHASHRLQISIVADSQPIDSVIYCRCCGTYATRKWSRRFACPCPAQPYSEHQTKMLLAGRLPQHSKANSRLIHTVDTSPEAVLHAWSSLPR
eukprot:4027550-Amphidinium_carterae.1